MNNYLRLLIEDIFDESQESRSISGAKALLMQNGFSDEESDKLIRVDLRNDIPILRNKRAAKFIMGAARFIYVDGGITSADDALVLNGIIKLIADGHYNEYDRDFNGLDFATLYHRFRTVISQNVSAEREELAKQKFGNKSNYKIIRIKSFKDAKKYSNYTDWCITNNENMYNTYTNNGENQFYFCLRKDFLDVPKKEGENSPLDDYGLSMLAVCVDKNGDLHTCTCRWNHDCGASDSIMNVKEISNIIGRNFYKVFKPYDSSKVKMSKLQKALKSNTPLENIFDSVGNFIRGVANITLGNKANWVTKDREILSSGQWYDTTDPFINGFSIVSLDKKYNFVDLDGNLLSPNIWFDDVNAFSNGIASVKLNGKYNFLTHKGNLFLNFGWVDEFYGFKGNKNYSIVKNNEKCNVVNLNGELISKDKWFDYVYDLSEGFFIVEVGDKMNFMDTNGNILTPDRWYDDAFDFNEGLGEVSYNDEWWNIDKTGKLIKNRELNESVKSKLDVARKETNKTPSENQKKSGNYKKGHINVNGFKITLENPKGSYRSGKDSNGKEWKIKMNNDYGYFLNTLGYDGDHIDVFLGSDIDSKKIFVIDQKVNGKFDESKVMLWFNTADSAKKAYLSNYEKDWKGFDEITEVDEDFFKKWLYDGKKQRKPFHEYYEVKNKIKKMKIKESILRKFIRESIDKIAIKEGLQERGFIKKLIKNLYEIAYPYTKNKYRDNDWRNVLSLFKSLEETPGVTNFSYGGGKYHADPSLNGKDISGLLNAAYKEYILEFETEVGINIGGKVHCNFCGSVDDPLSAYDITVSFYEDDRNMNESAIDDSIKNDIYTNDDWAKDGTLRVRVGQYISNDIYEELLNAITPATDKSTLFQPGEAYSMSEDYIDLYMTFIPENGLWKYIGLCPKGTKYVMPEIGEMNEGALNESRGLKSEKLFKLAKEHGGFSDDYSYAKMRLHYLTDNDVIGLIPNDELKQIENYSWNEQKRWAEDKGFTVNRGDKIEFAPLKDYSWVAIIERGSLLPDKEYAETEYGKMKSERRKNKSNDGARKYNWSDDKGGLMGSDREQRFNQLKR